MMIKETVEKLEIIQDAVGIIQKAAAILAGDVAILIKEGRNVVESNDIRISQREALEEMRKISREALIKNMRSILINQMKEKEKKKNRKKNIAAKAA